MQQINFAGFLSGVHLLFCISAVTILVSAYKIRGSSGGSYALMKPLLLPWDKYFLLFGVRLL